MRMLRIYSTIFVYIYIQYTYIYIFIYLETKFLFEHICYSGENTIYFDLFLGYFVLLQFFISVLLTVYLLVWFNRFCVYLGFPLFVDNFVPMDTGQFNLQLLIVFLLSAFHNLDYRNAFDKRYFLQSYKEIDF